jgi:YD repeat-containing protein
MPNTTPSFVTQAGNFMSAVAGDVDPRTGLYGVNITLGHLIGNRGAGPNLPLSLAYSPLSAIQGDQGQDLGLGSGMSLNLSMYDRTNQLLLLSTGERYPTAESAATQDADGGWKIPLVQQGVLSVTLKRYDSSRFNIPCQWGTIDGYYQVTHKSGDIEILMGTRMGGSLKLPLLMVNPAGHALTLQWSSSATGVPRLATITDDTPTSLQNDPNGPWTTLLSATYDTGSLRFAFFPNSPESYEADLVYDQSAGMVSQIELKKDPSSDAALTWTLGYTGMPDKWGSWLTDLTSPGGATERADYVPTHVFPSGANLAKMPAVATYTKTPGAGQPAIVTTFSYTSQQPDGAMAGHNFVAGNTNIASWSKSRDNLYDYGGGEYAYGSTETCGNRAITRVFDKFHLQRSETLTQSDPGLLNAKTTTSITDYYGDHSLSYDALVKTCVYFQCPQRKTITWVDGTDPQNDPSWTETASYDWDNWGNPIRKTAPNGLITHWAYYDETKDTQDGNGALLCPADPNGFRRFAQWKQVDPTQVTLSASMVAGAPLQRFDYTYGNAKPAAGYGGASPYVKALVLKNYESHTSSGSVSGVNLADTVFSEATYSYDAQGGLDAGRLLAHVTLHYPNGKTSTASTNYQATETFGYVPVDYSYLDPDNPSVQIQIPALATTHTLTANDPDVKPDPVTAPDHPVGLLTVVKSQIQSAFSGRQYSRTDELANETRFVYDFLGRMTQRTLNAASAEHANTLTYRYAIGGTLLGDDATYPFQVGEEDARHNKVCYTMDGLRRTIRRDVNAVDVSDVQRTWWTMETRGYDSMGRLAAHTVFDYDVDAQGDVQASYALSTTSIVYDNWGNAHQTIYSDGTADIKVHDPVNKTIAVTRGTSSDGQTAATATAWQVTSYDYNFSHKPITVERRYNAPTPADAMPYSLRSRVYNGLYWVASDTDECNRTVSYQYDPWGRVTTTTLPDQSIVTRHYCDKSPSNWVDRIEITGQLTGQTTGSGGQKPPYTGTCKVGTRTFDMLGRITAKRTGTVTWINHYPYDANVYDGYTRPTAVDAPDGYTHRYTYNYAFNEALQTGAVDSYKHDYLYEPITGILNSAEADVANSMSSSLSFTPFDSGRLRSESIVYASPSSPASEARALLTQQTQYTYTIGGALSTYTHVDNAVSTISRDARGRISNVSDGAVSVTPTYDPAGRLTGWAASNGSYTVTTTLTLDDFGREAVRTISDNTDTWTITQNLNWQTPRATQWWQPNDLLKQRWVQRNGGPPRVEIYTYDARNRLTIWDGDNNDPANLSSFHDRYGRTLTKQSFTIDALNNITSVTTKFSNIKNADTANFYFDYSIDPCRLLGGSYSNPAPAQPPSFEVQYDDAGRILHDGQGMTLTYDPLGRVNGATSTLTGLSGTYSYDPFNRQSVQAGDRTTYFYYRANELVNLIQGDSNNVRLQRTVSGAPAAQFNSAGKDQGLWLLGTDRLGSVMTAGNGQAATTDRAYSAYGEDAIVKPSTKAIS